MVALANLRLGLYGLFVLTLPLRLGQLDKHWPGCGGGNSHQTGNSQQS